MHQTLTTDPPPPAPNRARIRSKLVATAYPDRRDGVPTPAHTLGDDSLLIKYINPRLLAFATLSPDNSESVKTVDRGAGSSDGKGQELMVSEGA